MTERSTERPARRRRILLITDDAVVNGPDGLNARLASTRLRLLVALEALNAAGHQARLVCNTTPLHIQHDREFANADGILFGKVFQDYAGLAAAARTAGKTICIDVTDDLQRYRMLAPMRALVDLVDTVTVPSDELGRLVGEWTGHRLPVMRIVDPLEHAPARPGGDPCRAPLRLLWFGSPTNARHLLPHVPGLAGLAERRPIELAIVSTGERAFDGLLDRYHFSRGMKLQVRFVEWSPDAQQRELDHCDLVILPGNIEADSGLKSANRLITAIAAGRLAVASPLPSYQPFADHALLVDDMADGIEMARAMPVERRHAAVLAGQAMIERDYARAVIGRHWVEALTGSGQPARGS